MGLFRNPERIPDAVRGLAYTSMILTIPSLVFSLIFFYGSLSYFASPACVGASWIYHAIIIAAERRGRRTQYTAYSSCAALGFGIILALGWIIALGFLSLSILWVYWYERPLVHSIFAILEYICVVGHAGAMWALLFFAMRGRRPTRATELTVAVVLENSRKHEDV